MDPASERMSLMPASPKNVKARTRAQKSSRLTRARRTAILKALADPRRFELLERIAKAGCPLGCAQACAALPISAATLSHHIKELETAGLIRDPARRQIPLSLSASWGSGVARRHVWPRSIRPPAPAARNPPRSNFHNQPLNPFPLRLQSIR